MRVSMNVSIQCGTNDSTGNETHTGHRVESVV